jgi:hypothetical protein
MTLSQIFFHQQTIFAIFIYCISVIIAIPSFVFIHERLNHTFLQFCWDKIGMPLVRTFLIIGFILLIYPINFGIESAPSINKLLSIGDMRSSFLINIIFLLTFFFPFIPVIKKWEELIIPLQGILASMIIFSWLCQGLNLESYHLLPDFKTISFIIIISLITHWLAIFFSSHTGKYFDKLYHREGFQVLIFKAVVLIMQSPVIFIFGRYLGKQII